MHPGSTWEWSRSTTGRITLGTAQLAAGYGATRRGSDAPSVTDVARLLEAARELGIGRIDTAADYGDAERLLGAAGLGGFSVDAKLPALPPALKHSDAEGIASWVRMHVEQSLERLRVPSLAALLLHRPTVITSAVGPTVVAAVGELQQEGLVGQLGASVYGPDEGLPLVDAVPGLSIIQAPVSAVDRRMLAPQVVKRLEADGVELHARSVYLQGLLLVRPTRRPIWARAFDGALRPWDDWVEQNALDTAEIATAALGFVFRRTEVSRVIVGAEDAEQLRATVGSLSPAEPFDGLAEALPDEVAVADLDVIDPRRWTTS